ncbi:hypothetical protein BC827DRAFT_758476 [Russula dissimulans]|nr:hypothetical protein BC827DRAFT_758476 [Russula dissimulans]
MQFPLSSLCFAKSEASTLRLPLPPGTPRLSRRWRAARWLSTRHILYYTFGDMRYPFPRYGTGTKGGKDPSRVRVQRRKHVRHISQCSGHRHTAILTLVPSWKPFSRSLARDMAKSLSHSSIPGTTFDFAHGQHLAITNPNKKHASAVRSPFPYNRPQSNPIQSNHDSVFGLIIT